VHSRPLTEARLGFEAAPIGVRTLHKPLAALLGGVSFHCKTLTLFKICYLCAVEDFARFARTL